MTKKSSSNHQTDVDGPWTRSRAAEELDTSMTSIRRLEASGKLNPTVDERGRHLHDPDEVRRLKRAKEPAMDSSPPEYDGDLDAETASEIFDLFAEGMRAVDVVRATRHHPETVWKALEWYNKLNPAFINTPDSLERLDELEAVVARTTSDVNHLIGVQRAACECPNCGGDQLPIVRRHYPCCDVSQIQFEFDPPV